MGPGEMNSPSPRWRYAPSRQLVPPVDARAVGGGFRTDRGILCRDALTLAAAPMPATCSRWKCQIDGWFGRRDLSVA